MRLHIAALAAALALGVTGCATAKPPATPPPPDTTASWTPSPTAPTPAETTPPTAQPQPLPTQTGVTSGAFCSDEGRAGITKSGTKMVCKTTPTDSRLRWRRA